MWNLLDGPLRSHTFCICEVPSASFLQELHLPHHQPLAYYIQHTAQFSRTKHNGRHTPWTVGSEVPSISALVANHAVATTTATTTATAAATTKAPSTLAFSCIFGIGTIGGKVTLLATVVAD